MSHQYEFLLETASPAETQKIIKSLMDQIATADETLEPVRVKDNDDTMDLGATIAVLATSAAATAIATGIKIWLSKHQGAKVTVKKDGTVTASGITSKDAVRITEAVQ